MIHNIDPVKILIVGFSDLAGTMGTDGDAFFHQFFAGRRIDGVSDLLPAGSSGIYLIKI